MTANAAFISQKRKKFREWVPLYFYITTTKAKESKSKLTLDVRYMGQNIAKLACDRNDKVTISTKDYDIKNQHYLGCGSKRRKTISSIKLKVCY